MVPFCGDGWIRYHNKCFNFSVVEGNWTTASDSCTSLQSSLAVFEDQDEQDFLIQHKGVVDRWIGLKKQKEETWMWVDGSTYDPWFEIKGRSNCAYLNHQGVSSARCSAIRHWICSKRDKYK
ncbi:C-type lectin domain family 2 member B-like [Lissotriton helveticus]